LQSHFDFGEACGMNAIDLPAAYLSECLTYDPVTGNLFWKVRPQSHFPTKKGWHYFNKMFAGQIAGHEGWCGGQPNSIRVRIYRLGSSRGYLAHRIAFALMGVVIPPGFEVDHQNGNPFDNSWTNLRLATVSQNAQNKRRQIVRLHNETPKGVDKLKTGKFQARIRKDGQYIYLGLFKTAEEAHAAYCNAANEMFGEFARFN
jgi:hypothetical protein